MTATEIPTLQLFECRSLPRAWVVREETSDGDRYWIVPAVADGWSRRTPYRGHLAALEPAPGYCWMGIGIPSIRRPWSEVCHDRQGFN